MLPNKVRNISRADRSLHDADSLEFVMTELWHCVQCRYDLCPPCFSRGCGYGAALWSVLCQSEAKESIRTGVAQLRSGHTPNASHFGCTPRIAVRTEGIWDAYVGYLCEQGGSIGSDLGTSSQSAGENIALAVFVQRVGRWDTVYRGRAPIAEVPIEDVGDKHRDSDRVLFRVRALNVLGVHSVEERIHRNQIEVSAARVDHQLALTRGLGPARSDGVPRWLERHGSRKRHTINPVGAVAPVLSPFCPCDVHGLCHGDYTVFCESVPSALAVKVVRHIAQRADSALSAALKAVLRERSPAFKRIVGATVAKCVRATDAETRNNEIATQSLLKIPTVWDPGSDEAWSDMEEDGDASSPAEDQAVLSVDMHVHFCTLLAPRCVTDFLQQTALDLAVHHPAGDDWPRHVCDAECTDSELCRVLKTRRMVEAQMLRMRVSTATSRSAKSLLRSALPDEVDICDFPFAGNKIFRGTPLSIASESTPSHHAHVHAGHIVRALWIDEHVRAALDIDPPPSTDADGGETFSPAHAFSQSPHSIGDID